MKYIFFLTTYLLSISFLFSQQKIIEVSTVRGEDNSVQFSFISRYPGSVYLTISLTKLRNTSTAGVRRQNVQGNGSLFKLKPRDSKNGISYSYRYSFMYGKAVKKVDEQFVYALPFKHGSDIKVYDLNYLGEKYGNKAPKNWKFIKFVAMANDTIYAARKGTVVEIENQYDADESMNYTFKSKSNYILIEHRDGSLARYSVLKKNSVIVKLGQIVYPQTALAQAGTFDKPENSQLRFAVYFLDKSLTDKKANKKESLANQQHYNTYVNPIFQDNEKKVQLVSGEKYRVYINETLIEKEMSKREKKRRIK